MEPISESAASGDAVAIFGTAEPVTPERIVELGALSFRVTEGAVRGVAWGGNELVRGIDYPLRDRDWGTMLTRSTGTIEERDESSFRSARSFETADGMISGACHIDASADGRLEFTLDLRFNDDLCISRAGFTLLHPAALAGEPVRIVHGDGSEQETKFPLLISPAQPAKDICGMRYGTAGATVEIQMTGDVFEMEDQRNWTDASFKTYCRPLSLPVPYPVRKGEVIRQQLVLTFSGEVGERATTPVPALRIRPEPEGRRGIPEIMLAVEPAWEAPALLPLPAPLPELRRLVRADLRSDGGYAFLASVPDAPFDLELIVSDALAEATAQLTRAASRCAVARRWPDHAIALPAAYLKSYQPDGIWPRGATPDDLVQPLRQAFPGCRIGGGTLTNFTELNRCRPALAPIDYVTHGTAAIVHSADDRAVFETLEALPDIFGSVAAMAPDKPYRLGLVTIGMRSNPYGESLADNPEKRRRTMTADDPRFAGLFGAAWLVGAVAATSGSAVEAMALASPRGPFAAVEAKAADSPTLRPAFHVLRELQLMQGHPRLTVETGHKHLYAVAAAPPEGARILLANGGPDQQACHVPEGIAAVLRAEDVADAAADPAWTEHAASPRPATLILPPYAVAFIRTTNRWPANDAS